MHHASIIVGTPKGINKTIVVLEKIVFSTCKNVIRKKQVQWNLDITKGQGNAKILFCYNEVSLYRSSFSYILLLLGGKRIVQECNAKRLTVGGVGGGGVLNKVLYRESSPRSPTPHPFYTIFGSFDHFLIVPLHYTFHLTNGTPCTYLVKALRAFNCCKFTVCFLI